MAIGNGGEAVTPARQGGTASWRRWIPRVLALVLAGVALVAVLRPGPPAENEFPDGGSITLTLPAADHRDIYVARETRVPQCAVSSPDQPDGAVIVNGFRGRFATSLPRSGSDNQSWEKFQDLQPRRPGTYSVTCSGGAGAVFRLGASTKRSDFILGCVLIVTVLCWLIYRRFLRPPPVPPDPEDEQAILALELGKVAAIGGRIGGRMGGALWGGGRVRPVRVARFFGDNVGEGRVVLPLPFDEAVRRVGRLADGNELVGRRTDTQRAFRLVTRAGFFNLNPAVVTLTVTPTAPGASAVTIRAVAKEGLVKQRAGEEAAKRVAAQLDQLTSGE